MASAHRGHKQVEPAPAEVYQSSAKGRTRDDRRARAPGRNTGPRYGPLAQGKEIVPLVGARKRDHLAESLGAVDVHLDGSDLAQIARAVRLGAAAGERYCAYLMGQLDSDDV